MNDLIDSNLENPVYIEDSGYKVSYTSVDGDEILTNQNFDYVSGSGFGDSYGFRELIQTYLLLRKGEKP